MKPVRPVASLSDDAMGSASSTISFRLDLEMCQPDFLMEIVKRIFRVLGDGQPMRIVTDGRMINQGRLDELCQHHRYMKGFVASEGARREVTAIVRLIRARIER